MKPNGCVGCTRWGEEMNSCNFSKYPLQHILSCSCKECLIKTLCRGVKNVCNEFEKKFKISLGYNQKLGCKSFRSKEKEKQCPPE